MLRTAFDTGAVDLGVGFVANGPLSVSVPDDDHQEPRVAASRSGKLSVRSGSSMKQNLEHNMKAKHYESLGCRIQKQAKTTAVKTPERQGDTTGPRKIVGHVWGLRAAELSATLPDAIIR